MSELLYWIALDCTGVPNEVAGECIYSIYSAVTSSFILLTTLFSVLSSRH